MVKAKDLKRLAINHLGNFVNWNVIPNCYRSPRYEEPKLRLNVMNPFFSCSTVTQKKEKLLTFPPIKRHWWYF